MPNGLFAAAVSLHFRNDAQTPKRRWTPRLPHHGHYTKAAAKAKDNVTAGNGQSVRPRLSFVCGPPNGLPPERPANMFDNQTPGSYE
jgi:hypothetical protein